MASKPKILSLHRFVLGTVVEDEFQTKMYSDDFATLRNNAKGLSNWKIIRASDNIVIAQSKQPAAPQAPSPTPALGASEPIHQQHTRGTAMASKKLTPAQDYAIEQLWKHGNFVNMRSDLRPYSSTITALRKMGLIELDESKGIWFAYHLTEAGQALATELFGSSEPQACAPDEDSPTILTYEMLDDIRSAGTADLEALYADDSSLPFASFDEPAPVPTIDSSVDVVLLDTPVIKITTRIQLPTPTPVRSGHGRNKLPKTRRNQPKRAKSRDLRHRKTSGINMELRTPKARNWRKRRNLHNATAMPSPTITGMELLQAGQQLTVVEKPKRLTRYLEAA